MNDQPANDSLGLALSGGGFRATLFHLGVVRALAETGQLSRVTHISSVSGGSILAAHLVLNWEQYEQASCLYAQSRRADAASREATVTQARQSFEKATESLLQLMQSDTRNRILRRIPWILAGQFVYRFLGSTVGKLPLLRLEDGLREREDRCRVVELLAKEYEAVFGIEPLATLGTRGRPSLAIMATEVASMEHAWFVASGFRQPHSTGGAKPIGGDVMTIAKSVAASSAFPALFPPVKLDGNLFRFDTQRRDRHVTDAGVYDNLGLSAFLDEPFAKCVSLTVVSDATATSDWDSDRSPGLVANLLRSVDIMQQRTAQLQRQRVGFPERDTLRGEAGSGAHRSGAFVLLDIARGDISEPPMAPALAQRHLSYVRTDLDSFSDEELRLLVHHGYSVAWHVMKETKLIPDTMEPHFSSWSDAWPRRQSPAENSTRSARQAKEARSYSFRPFSLSDPVGLLNLVFVIAFLALPPAIYFGQKARTEAALLSQKEELERSRKEEVLASRKLHAKERVASYATFSPPLLQADRLANLGRVTGDPSYEGFTISSFEKVFDLRQWVPVPTNQLKTVLMEPVSQQTAYSVRRSPGATKLAFVHKTSGVVVPEIISFPSDYSRKEDSGSSELWPKQILSTADVSSIPDGVEFPLIVRSTYWNAFQKPMEDAAFKTYTEGDRGAMIVLFPTNRLPRNFCLFQSLPKSAPAVAIKEAIRPVPFYHFEQNGLYFEVERPTKGVTYGVMFSWNSEGGTIRLGEAKPLYDETLLPK